MDGNKSNISFIPKSSLVREESFLERPRPRSVIGFLAVAVFVLCVGGYSALSFYRKSLDEKIIVKTDEIRATQKEFADAPQVGKAQVFRSRVALAKELLDSHFVVSPALEFLADNTITSIFYGDLSFKHDATGETLELPGEAPTYAALAYQGDLLLKRTEALSSSSIHSVELTKYGTITFVLTMTFVPGYLSYEKNLSIAGETLPKVVNTGSASTTLRVVTATSTPVSISTSSSRSLATSSVSISPSTVGMNDKAMNVGLAGTATTSSSMVKPVVSKQSVFGSLWAKFKFW